MRAFITGAHGQVGYELLQRVPSEFSAFGYRSQDLDISSSEQVLEAFKTIKPELVINAAAYTAVDEAESEAERAYAVNRDGVALLAAAAEELGIPIFHISTDYVFSGDKNEPYTPEDVTNPTGVYGLGKLAGEQQLQQRCSRNVILRTSWIFGSHGNNFFKTMLRLGRDRDALSVVSDQYGCPTSAGSIADTPWALASIYQKERHLKWGLYHYSGFPTCTWYDFAGEIFRQSISLDLLEKHPTLNVTTTAQYPPPAQRPASSVLDNQELEAYGLKPKNWRQELHMVLKQLAKN
ncbi:dTDP-4-dehydrorhamnose reductase [Pseudomonas fluorescens]|uniref:dTDP-4-dehydrorhamnose reductase n=1 Tax=Pseudomonas fluorescens TaxID=294 RepID=A0A8H2P083_PSEFL|nr:dTDP-4-dehydrorhamnose reductase [Pseudomonas fluorescens]VVP59779.1 dTDP-4-dehydrorhamnose reductase [Pseudomonas fluorescens]